MPQAEQNMEGRFYQRNRPKTTTVDNLGVDLVCGSASVLAQPYEALSTCTAVP